MVFLKSTYLEKVVQQRDASNSWPRPRFLYYIINNKESGLDLDKLDYYQRDCYYTGISMRNVYDNLLDTARVMGCDDGVKRMAYPEKYVVYA